MDNWISGFCVGAITTLLAILWAISSDGTSSMSGSMKVLREHGQLITHQDSLTYESESLSKLEFKALATLSDEYIIIIK